MKHWTIKVAVDAGKDIVIEIDSAVPPRATVELLVSRGVWRDDDFWYPPNRIVYVTLQEAQPQPPEGQS